MWDNLRDHTTDWMAFLYKQKTKVCYINAVWGWLEYLWPKKSLDYVDQHSAVKEDSQEVLRSDDWPTKKAITANTDSRVSWLNKGHQRNTDIPVCPLGSFKMCPGPECFD